MRGIRQTARAGPYAPRFAAALPQGTRLGHDRADGADRGHRAQNLEIAGPVSGHPCRGRDLFGAIHRPVLYLFLRRLAVSALDSDASPSAGSMPGPKQERMLRTGAIACAIAVLWLATRPYPGVVFDARFYMVEALRALDPTHFDR